MQLISCFSTLNANNANITKYISLFKFYGSQGDIRVVGLMIKKDGGRYLL